MRRKCFYLLVIVLIFLYAFDFMGIPLSGEIDEVFFERSIVFTGKVVEVQQKDDYLRLTVKPERADGAECNLKENVLLNFYGEEEHPWELLNSRISFKTKLERPSGRRNPYCFDYAKYLKSRRIGAVASVNTIETEPGSLTMRERYERKLCEKKHKFCHSLSDESRGMVMGVLFGDTSFLDEDAYDLFRKNGTAHILAVSGLHVGLIYRIYQKLAGRKKNIAALIALTFVLYTYGELSGWSPSVGRAVLMIGMSVFARFADLRYDMLTAASTVALILIGKNPYVIFGAGFQMSFLAICSIVFLKPLIPVKIPDNAAVMLSVYLGLLPYQIYQFNYISVTALAANIPVIYLAGFFVPLSAVGFIVFVFFGEIRAIESIIDAVGSMIFYINKMTSIDGHGGFDVESPPIWVVLAATLLMFFLSSETRVIIKMRGQKRLFGLHVCTIFFLSLMVQLLVYCPVSDDHVIFVDVGQGDCVHIKAGNSDVLIDGGGAADYNVGKKILKTYLLKNGTADIDLAIATHEHMDHIKGLNELSDVFNVKKLSKGLTAGTEIEIDRDIRIETLWPEQISGDNGQEENEMCSVFMIYYKGYKILVTGDLDEIGEKRMMEKYSGTDKLKADVLKIGHHGSSTSTCEEFLEIVNPVYAVIQTGKNIYGHPSPKIIEKCMKKGIMVYRNDLNGAVGFSFRKKGIICHTVTGNGE